jgi:glyoxylase-like metal-dependent hydrolase (beta-lactamase superfamily II)
MMSMTVQVAPDIYQIDVPLPKNPLKNLNSYVVKGQGGHLIIDTGFNRRECREALLAGLNQLNIDMNETDIFLTHFHSDHSGLAAEIASDQTRIFISAADEPLLRVVSEKESLLSVTRTALTEKLYTEEGFPAQDIVRVKTVSPGRVYSVNKVFPYTHVRDGDTLHIGGRDFTCVATPGHTPGHMCLYLEREKIMFLGDHVLFDITPNIAIWAEIMMDSLDYFIQSLNKIKQYDCRWAFPAHRSVSGDLNQRIEQLLDHHQARLQDILRIVREHKQMNAYQIASHMKWDINAKCWEDFPLAQKWFAVGEAIAHLNHLTDHEQLVKTKEQGVFWYALP